MTDDLTKKKIDGKKVNLKQQHEVDYWCSKWGITEGRLRLVIAKVGQMVADIDRYIKNSAS